MIRPKFFLAWRLSNTMDVGFCVMALEEALARFGSPEIFNTDQGSQFSSFAFTADTFDSGGPYPVGITAGDLNKDGKLDLVIANAGDVQSFTQFGENTAVQVLYGDGNSGLIQAILLSIDEAYFHCPRSFQFADLWNTETIAANAQRSIKDLKKG